MTDVGTWAWAERTGGTLNRRDTMTLVRQAVRTQLATLPLPWRRSAAPDPSRWVMPDPPDSALARATDEHVRDASTPGLYAHCVRTWLFATAFAAYLDIAHDPELLYVTCLLHDLGLTPAHDQVDAQAHCFGVEGARAARAFLLAQGESEDRALPVAEAISLHLNPKVGIEHGGEAVLVNRGALLDVMGGGIRDLPRSATSQIVRQWPRTELRTSLIDANTAQAAARPRSRAAFLNNLPGGARLVAANPLDRGSA